MRPLCKTWPITSTTCTSSRKSFPTRWKTLLNFQLSRSQQTFWSMTLGKKLGLRNGQTSMFGTTTKNLKLAGKTPMILSRRKSSNKWNTMELTYKRLWAQQTKLSAKLHHGAPHTVQTKRSVRWQNCQVQEKNWCEEWLKSHNLLMINQNQAAQHREKERNKREFLNWQKMRNLPLLIIQRNQ